MTEKQIPMTVRVTARALSVAVLALAAPLALAPATAHAVPAEVAQAPACATVMGGWDLLRRWDEGVCVRFAPGGR
jgi:hypothetical protein